MECKHPYYRIVDGKLVCAQCGQPSPREAKEEDKLSRQPEDKVAERHEAKIWHPESKRISAPAHKAGKRR